MTQAKWPKFKPTASQFRSDPAVTKAGDDERQPMRVHVNTVTLLPGRMHCSFAVPLDLTWRISRYVDIAQGFCLRIAHPACRRGKYRYSGAQAEVNDFQAARQLPTMCGILAALGLTGDPETNRRLVLRCSKLLRHRGPDANSIYQSRDGKNFLAFERLQIIDPSDGGRCAEQLAASCLTRCLQHASNAVLRRAAHRRGN